MSNSGLSKQGQVVGI